MSKSSSEENKEKAVAKKVKAKVGTALLLYLFVGHTVMPS
jgi:hypothetical protein